MNEVSSLFNIFNPRVISNRNNNNTNEYCKRSVILVELNKTFFRILNKGANLLYPSVSEVVTTIILFLTLFITSTNSK